MAEAKIHDDPSQHEPRNVFGKFTKRQALAGSLCAAIMTAAVALVFKFGLPLEPVVILGALACMPAGVLAMSPIRGLHAEKWIPLAMDERKAPKELTWGPRRLILEVPEERPTRAEARARRREHKRDVAERKGEVESGGPDIRLMAEKEVGR